MKPKISTAYTCEIGGKSDRCGKPANDFFKLQSHDGVVLIDSWFCPKHFAEVLDEHKDWGPIQRRASPHSALTTVLRFCQLPGARCCLLRFVAHLRRTSTTSPSPIEFA